MSNVTVTAEDTFVFADAVIGGNPGALQVAPKFPLSLAATEDLLNFSNSFPSDVVPTLAADVTADDTTILLDTGAGDQFPLQTFEFSMDDEIIFVGVRSGDTLTECRRGADGSTPAIHFAGATAQLLITALSHNQLVSEVIEIEHLLGPRGSHIFTTEINITSSAPGDFTVAHGLGITPRLVLLQPTSGGAIWFQPALRYDETNLYLTASDAGVTAIAEAWL